MRVGGRGAVLEKNGKGALISNAIDYSAADVTRLSSCKGVTMPTNIFVV